MKSPLIVHFAGSSEEDEARLRLLLRSARKHLQFEWSWGEAADADLRLLDADGRSTPADAPPPGTARAEARIVAEDAPEPAGRYLRRPLASDAFVALLESVAAEAAQRADADAAPAPVATESAPAGLPSANAPAAVAEPVADDRTVAPAGEEDALRPLPYYLPKRVLGGPARIERAGAPALTIDPESRSFLADGALPGLEPYFREPLRFGDWQRLTAEELETVRLATPARPLTYLTWMDTYLHSGGVLSRRLDPEGTYAVSRRLDLANDYPHALRISTQMTRPRRLDAIARACGVALGEVHDVVNAFEAIGYLEWTRAGSAAGRR